MRPPGFEPGRRGWKPLMLPLHHGRATSASNQLDLTASMRGLMIDDLHPINMTPLGRVGILFIFIFMPVNIPLWDILFEYININLSGHVVTPPLFLLGILILFNPKRQKQPVGSNENVLDEK